MNDVRVNRSGSETMSAGSLRRLSVLRLDVRFEHDVVFARQRTRQIAARLGFDPQDQTRLATAVSELARNAYQYARGGSVEFAVERASASESAARDALVVRVVDQGPGIPHLDSVLQGAYVSATGMGLGILGARRLADRFFIEAPAGGGTTIEIAKLLPREARRLASEAIARVAEEVARDTDDSPFAEVQRQNQELLRAMGELERRGDDIERLNAELAETNRGVLALYAELEDRAEDLRRASDVKSRFLSDMSHELRAPLASMLNLTRLLLERTDGDLSVDQEYQVSLIRDAAVGLSDMVNDLLDLAKIEAGRVTIKPKEFAVADLFGALRGMFRPLVARETVMLVFEGEELAGSMCTDQTRVAQILRNFLSNALKFTERGSIRVSVHPEVVGDGPERLRFSVADSGIGIAKDDLERIFDDYEQVDHPIQERVQGTGLGLPLTRKLAALLGGRIDVTSAVGVGSTFSVILPRMLAGCEGGPGDGMSDEGYLENGAAAVSEERS
jgi:signal transduction histidine kinase